MNRIKIDDENTITVYIKKISVSNDIDKKYDDQDADKARNFSTSKQTIVRKSY